ncbi:hypothetical protein HJG39_11445 [Alteromonas sp. a30]|nr:hypothetical protein [Alteromonas sp. a30]
MPLGDAGYAFAQEEDAKPKRKVRRTPALRARVYEQLARAQKLGDGGDTAAAIDVLNKVKDKSASMNSYEKAMMYNFYGFIYYNAEDYDKAIDSFALVVEQQPIPESFEQSTLFSLSQLNLMRGNYDKSIEYLERWESINAGDIPPKNYLLKAQARYQQKDYKEALAHINKAVELVEADPERGVAEENWYILQRAIYYELKQPKKVTEILVKLVRHYNEPKYWIQLGGMYGEIGEEKKQLAVMESAYQQGFIETGSDMFNLAQLYYYHQVPYKAARLMVDAMDSGKLDKNLRNLRFLSQCWAAAKESEKAVPVMLSAADLSVDGELDAQLSQIFLNEEKWDQAIVRAQKALDKGGLRNPGVSHLVIGMALYNKKEYNAALNALAEAEKHKSSRKMAQQWKQFVNGEKQTQARLEAELSS